MSAADPLRHSLATGVTTGEIETHRPLRTAFYPSAPRFQNFQLTSKLAHNIGATNNCQKRSTVGVFIDYKVHAAGLQQPKTSVADTHIYRLCGIDD